MSTNGDYLLSANDFLWSASNGYVDVYDSNESLVDSIYLDGHGAQSMCATPDGSHVYVTMNDTGLIYEVDPNTLSINNYYQSEYVQRFTGCASDGNTVFFTAYDDSEVRAYTLDLSNYYGGSCSSCWAVTYNSYTDEYAATSDGCTGSIANGNNRIGWDGADDGSNCQIAEFAIYSRVLGVNECRWLYQLGRGGMLERRRRRRVYSVQDTGNRRRRIICGAEC